MDSYRTYEEREQRELKVWHLVTGAFIGALLASLLFLFIVLSGVI